MGTWLTGIHHLPLKFWGRCWFSAWVSSTEKTFFTAVSLMRSPHRETDTVNKVYRLNSIYYKRLPLYQKGHNPHFSDKKIYIIWDFLQKLSSGPGSWGETAQAITRQPPETNLALCCFQKTPAEMDEPHQKQNMTLVKIWKEDRVSCVPSAYSAADTWSANGMKVWCVTRV